MADPVCTIKEASSAADKISTSATLSEKRTVTKVCVNPLTLKTISTTKVRLTDAEVREVQDQYHRRMYGSSSVFERNGLVAPPGIVTDDLIQALNVPANLAAAGRTPPAENKGKTAPEKKKPNNHLK